ncbi:hypothetical protein NE237_031180 [Protea cynaroides]|uniref:Uncharacterized protein n=1 Tax=Protea cynaroides TaxID=273540 RepID=A0A9Q0L0T4_9MAGN|nr:hypothetical protein NE237_031180 [Protea cynaroides]
MVKGDDQVSSSAPLSGKDAPASSKSRVKHKAKARRPKCGQASSVASMPSPFVVVKYIGRDICKPSLEGNNEEEAAPSAGLKRKTPVAKEPLKKRKYAVDKGKEIEGASAIGDPVVAETLSRVVILPKDKEIYSQLDFMGAFDRRISQVFEELSFLTDTKDYIIWLTGNFTSADEMIRTLQRDLVEGKRV